MLPSLDLNNYQGSSAHQEQHSSPSGTGYIGSPYRLKFNIDDTLYDPPV